MNIEITETSTPNYNDLKVWKQDFEEVQEQVNKWVSKLKEIPTEDKLRELLGLIHHNNAYNVCSDTYEPLEYIDFNYGSLTCTISIYDRTEPELLPSFDGYVRRNGEELADCYCDIGIEDITKTLLGQGILEKCSACGEVEYADRVRYVEDKPYCEDCYMHNITKEL